MLTNSKRNGLVGILIILMLLSLYYEGFACMAFNGTTRGYCDETTKVDCEEDFAKTSETNFMLSGDSIGTLVVKGGRNYFNSYSSFLKVLEIVEAAEIEGVNFDLLDQSIRESLIKLQLSREFYYDLILKADTTSYNKSFILKLKSFEYCDYQERNNLNAIIFDDVVFFLKAGDITGSYIYAYLKIIEIEQALKAMIPVIESGAVPKLETFWKVNESFAHTLLFAQYIARVCMTIQ